jgi:hypothetical protein
MAFADAQSGSVVFNGESPTVIKLAGVVTKGDAVGYSAGWKRALATAASVVQMRLVAGEDGVIGHDIIAYVGHVELGGTRFSGATIGGAVYVAEGTSNGMYTQTAPTTTADSNKIVGYAVAADRLHLFGSMNVDTIA